ncbi:MAG TPA: primosomal protein N' [Bacteroidia bacterium]|jgi:primosomal protein N' (replication factor Y)|nr:primosomal protein N' [Bacteroidia bacterium]
MSRLTLFADVLLPLAVPNLYTYRVPFELNEKVKPGIRVLVQFGKSKFYSALVKNVHENPPTYTAKYVEEVLDTIPVVNQKQFAFWEWISNYYLCYQGEVMNAALPSGLKLNSETKLVLNTDSDFKNETQSLADNEYILLEALETRNVLSYNEASQILSLKNPQVVIKQLLSKKLILLFEEVKEKYKPKMVSYVRLNKEYESEEKLKELFETLEKKAFKQVEVLLFYLKENKHDEGQSENKWIKKSALIKHFDGSAINSLVKKNIFTQQEFETGRLEQDDTIQLQKKLSAVQTKAFEEIETSYKEHDVCLLHGVTGSGKTEIYCALMEETLKRGKQALYLVPEIALTTQLISRVKKYFGDKVGVYHSRFSDNERVEVWNSVLPGGTKKDVINSSQYQIILGARSALFLPYSDLGLIIVDEEHDSSYKQQDPAPRYHARDAAIYLATLHKAKVLLGTATPCIESYYNAEQNKYGFVELNERHGESSMPHIEVIDTKAAGAKKSEQENIISTLLFEEIKKTLIKKEQVILFQNRRGFAPYTECNACGHVPCCVQCDVSLIYHKATQKLTCHYCGYTTNPPKACNACGSTDLRYKGFGTQKIEEEIEIMLPDARIKRMDMDSTRSKHAYKQIIDDFDAGEIDILTGTQMVTKGLDFDHVGLVGVLQADHLLSYPDFRSYERAFQLMTQVSGRAGRKEKKGKVLIQSSQPEHPVIDWVLKHDYKQMYNALLAERKEFLYPPFTRLFNFTFICKDYDLLNEAAESFGNALKKIFAQRVLGPEFPIVSRIKNEYHKQILLKTEREYSSLKVREYLQKIFFDYKTQKIFSKVRLKADVDPN